MPSNPKLNIIPPTPIDEEYRPLLDEQHPDHGTISETEAHLEEAAAEEPAVDEPSAWKLAAIMLPLFCSSFFAAAGKYIALYRLHSPRKRA